MKKTAILFFTLFSALFIHAQTNCNGGYESPLYTTPTPLNANFIYLEQITVNAAGTITGLSANTNGTSITQMRLALYESVNDVPGNLLFFTGALDVGLTPGTVTGSLIATPIAAGTYFIGGTVNTTCNVLTCDGSTSNLVYVSAFDFNSAFPANASSFMSVGGPVVNLWANITCEGNSVLEEGKTPLSIYYSREKNSLQISGLAIAGACVQVISMDGKILQTNRMNLSETANEIQLENFASGVYLVSVYNQGKLIHYIRFII